MISDDRLDTLIDDVARRMTEGAPASELTSRVLQRIDERQQRRRGWRAVWVAAPIAAAAVVLIALQVLRLKPDAGDVLKEVGATGPSVVRLKPDAAEIPKPDATDTSSVVRPTPSTTAKPHAAEPKVAAAEPFSSVDGLAPPRLDVIPLDVVPLDAGTTPPGSIELEQLETIAPIAVTPLGAGESPGDREF
jgi:hypothetical protein